MPLTFHPAVVYWSAVELIKVYMYKTSLRDVWKYHPDPIKTQRATFVGLLSVQSTNRKYTGSNQVTHRTMISEQTERCLGFEVQKVTTVIFSLLSNIKERGIRKPSLTTLISLWHKCLSLLSFTGIADVLVQGDFHLER